MAPVKAPQQSKREPLFRLPAEAPHSFTAADLDAVYDDPERDDDFGTAPSIIFHLLSQISIGMDLTKVSLPTHILERRSLLELYATFFTHADLLASIPTYDTPRERMVAMVRWYMSAFHVSLKPKRPKKPYNPVLGEVFKCYYRLDDEKYSGRVGKRGPLPWAKASDLVFVAEQVSHQPPVSAFYAECPKMNISCQAYIHTKTQFRGTHAVVQLVGRGTMTLHSHKEQFSCDFPTVYIRSIFSTPWLEFGDGITISYPKAKMTCEMKFITKSVFGSDRNCVKGLLKERNEVFAQISGHWNDVVEIAYVVRGKRSKAEFGTKDVLFDARARRYDMRVRPVMKQEPNESRRIWADVTYHLYKKNLELATAYKNKLEEDQRKLRLARANAGEVWKPKEFVAENGGWSYKKPYKPKPHEDSQ